MRYFKSCHCPWNNLHHSCPRQVDPVQDEPEHLTRQAVNIRAARLNSAADWPAIVPPHVSPDASRRLSQCCAVRVAAECSIENLAVAAAAAAPVSRVQPFEPVDEASPLTTRSRGASIPLDLHIWREREQGAPSASQEALQHDAPRDDHLHDVRRERLRPVHQGDGVAVWLARQ